MGVFRRGQNEQATAANFSDLVDAGLRDVGTDVFDIPERATIACPRGCTAADRMLPHVDRDPLSDVKIDVGVARRHQATALAQLAAVECYRRHDADDGSNNQLHRRVQPGISRNGTGTGTNGNHQ